MMAERSLPLIKMMPDGRQGNSNKYKAELIDSDFNTWKIRPEPHP
tara:strand:+ start:348 stop:482 length:135 start_codon:yes stop_codon:yes gene_type:complete